MKRLVLIAVLPILASTGAFAAPLAVSANATGPEFVSITAKARLTKLLDPVNYSFAAKSFQTVATIQNDKNVAAFSGCQSGDCGTNDALVIYDKNHDALKVILHVKGKKMIFNEKKSFNDAKFDTDLKTALSQ